MKILHRDRAELNQAIERLALAANEAETLSRDESLPIETRAGHYVRMQLLREEQESLLKPYAHANALGQRPNASHKSLPPVHPVERIFGAIVGLAFVCVIWAAYAVWTSRASIATLAWRFFL